MSAVGSAPTRLPIDDGVSSQQLGSQAQDQHTTAGNATVLSLHPAY